MCCGADAVLCRSTGLSAGLACHFSGTAPQRVCGVVIGKACADLQKVSEALKSAPSDVLWVFSQPKRPHTRAGVTVEDIEVQFHSHPAVQGRCVLLPLNDYWKHSRADHRRLMIDCEMASYCSLVLVFDDGGERCKWWRSQAQYNPKVRLFESAK